VSDGAIFTALVLAPAGLMLAGQTAVRMWVRFGMWRDDRAMRRRFGGR